MNKTLSIGLAGFSFTIEEHAYIKLNDYLAALRRSMEPEEANEVMQDIEMRIVEIFKSLPLDVIAQSFNTMAKSSTTPVDRTTDFRKSHNSSSG